MSGHDSAELVALHGAEVGALLLREVGALIRIDEKLRAMSDAESALGVDIASPWLAEMLWNIKSALTVIARELAADGEGAQCSMQ